MKQITLYTGGGVTFSPHWAGGRTESDYIRLVADIGMMLKKGNVTTLCIEVLKTDAPNWSEVPYVEPSPEPDPESETYPAWDIRSSTSFAVGDRVTSEGTIYECIKAHNASWTRQPPNAEYWRTV